MEEQSSLFYLFYFEDFPPLFSVDDKEKVVITYSNKFILSGRDHPKKKKKYPQSQNELLHKFPIDPSFNKQSDLTCFSLEMRLDIV